MTGTSEGARRASGARLSGHVLPYDGRLQVAGRLADGDANASGRTVCSCGEESPLLPSTNARRQWHRDHKDRIRAEMAAANRPAPRPEEVGSQNRMVPPVSGAVNEAFLRKVLHHIETHPELWDQRSLVNEGPDITTYCFAGWAYVLGTGEYFFNVHDLVLDNTRPILPTAAKLLGLSPQQASRLFGFIFRPILRGGAGAFKLVTFPDLCQRVYEVTGVQYVPTVTARRKKKSPLAIVREKRRQAADAGPA